jgi:charged multivesicular body protein 6
MGNNSGKGKGSSAAKHDVNDHDRAVLDLKVARDELKQYQKKTAVAMDRHTQVARELLKKGDKKNALLVVKKKKIGEPGISSIVLLRRG